MEVSDEGNLSAGDFSFFGNGEAGLVSIGIERKRISDLVSSIRSKRLSGFQLNELGREYDWAYLVVEGEYRCGKLGDLEEHRWNGNRMDWRSMRLLYREVDNYLTTIDHKAGTNSGNHIRIRRTCSPSETVAAVVDLYKWWQKGWNQHNSHEEIYDEYIPAMNATKGRYTRRVAGIAEKIAAQLPGVGNMAWDIGKYFTSRYPEYPVSAMSSAPVVEWADIDITVHGKDGDKKQKLGMKRAEKIWKALR